MDSPQVIRPGPLLEFRTRRDSRTDGASTLDFVREAMHSDQLVGGEGPVALATAEVERAHRLHRQRGEGAAVVVIRDRGAVGDRKEVTGVGIAEGERLGSAAAEEEDQGGLDSPEGEAGTGVVELLRSQDGPRETVGSPGRGGNADLPVLACRPAEQDPGGIDCSEEQVHQAAWERRPTSFGLSPYSPARLSY